MVGRRNLQQLPALVVAIDDLHWLQEGSGLAQEEARARQAAAETRRTLCNLQTGVAKRQNKLEALRAQYTVLANQCSNGESSCGESNIEVRHEQVAAQLQQAEENLKREVNYKPVLETMVNRTARDHSLKRDEIAKLQRELKEIERERHEVVVSSREYRFQSRQNQKAKHVAHELFSSENQARSKLKQERQALLRRLQKENIKVKAKIQEEARKLKRIDSASNAVDSLATNAREQVAERVDMERKALEEKFKILQQVMGMVRLNDVVTRYSAQRESHEAMLRARDEAIVMQETLSGRKTELEAQLEAQMDVEAELTDRRREYDTAMEQEALALKEVRALEGRVERMQRLKQSAKETLRQLSSMVSSANTASHQISPMKRALLMTSTAEVLARSLERSSGLSHSQLSALDKQSGDKVKEVDADLTSVAPPPSERGGRALSRRSSVERFVDEDEEMLRNMTKLGVDLSNLLAEIEAGGKGSAPGRPLLENADAALMKAVQASPMRNPRFNVRVALVDDAETAWNSTFADSALSESLDDWRSARAARELAAAKLNGTAMKPNGATVKPSSASTPRSAAAPASTIANSGSGSSNGSLQDKRYGNFQASKANVALTPLAVPRTTRTGVQSWALAATLAASPIASPTSPSIPHSARAPSRRASSSQGTCLPHPYTERPRVPSSAREARSAARNPSSSRRKH